MIYTTGTIAINGNTVTGTGTDFSAPLSLIRVGCTLIAVSDPIQIFTITEIKSDTELSVTPSANPAIPAGTKFSILLSDSISVDGLAQDVAETLRYYQSKETEVAEALEWSQNHIADKIGLGAEHRDWPDCNDPTGCIGFCRAVSSESRNFPSIASGETYLVGWLARGDTAVINGCFVGTTSLSLYAYRYNQLDNTTAWSKQVKQGDSTTFRDIVVEREMVSGVGIGGLVTSALKSSEGDLEASAGFCAEIRDDDKCYATISTTRGNKKAWAGLTEDGDFVLTNGDFVGRSVRLKSDADHPAIIESQSPTVHFKETDKPEGSPEYSLIVDGGNWKIEKNHYGENAVGDCVSYSYSEDAISVHKLKATEILTPDGNPYAASDGNGILVYDKGIKLHHSQDWNEQITDGINKFSPLDGSVNSPDPSMSFSGFHVQFATNYATQFAGSNSEFWARTYDNGVDGGWKKLATTNKQNQQWSAVQNFIESNFNSRDYSRALRLITDKTTQLNVALYTHGDTTKKSALEIDYTEPATNIYKTYGFCCQLNNDDSIQFIVNGSLNCTTLNQASDSDLKDNIKVISNATEAIRKMNGYTYTLKENGLPYAGIIAQEAMDAIPEAVGSFTYYGEALQGPTIDGNNLREETRYLNVDYAAVTGLLVQVARETDNRVTELEEENASLLANIAVMDERISKLEALVRQLTGSEE